MERDQLLFDPELNDEDNISSSHLRDEERNFSEKKENETFKLLEAAYKESIINADKEILNDELSLAFLKNFNKSNTLNSNQHNKKKQTSTSTNKIEFFK